MVATEESLNMKKKLESPHRLQSDNRKVVSFWSLLLLMKILVFVRYVCFTCILHCFS
ncbi:hypothetical protein BHE74_00047898 [Ensete ventricosum]|uniref:Uncharacterized protein n=1 Tax=Ensete ventricosum TaxID=4639 RepID=A0A426YI09_ENSVE|nr:hypothetical protein B296_00014240 [Ensete ventricosum]RWW46193.1 hypothetical protein BHE74_00047898 [Ensete ventricosum]